MPAAHTDNKLHITPYDSADYLTSAEDIEAYVQAIQEQIDAYPEQGAELTLLALGVIARAKNKVQLSKKAGLSRQGLYKVLAPDAKPSLATVFKLVHALDLKIQLVANPAGKHKAA